MAKSTSGPLTIRLPHALDEQLTQRAAAAEMTRGKLAKRLLIDAIADHRHHELRSELTELRHYMTVMREDLATAVIALLVGAGKSSRKEATAWVKKTLLK